jgi:hypothetical protein
MSPREHTIGRPCKVGKEKICGLDWAAAAFFTDAASEAR